MEYQIYKTTCIITGKSYVGQHKTPKEKENFMRYLGSGIALKAAIKKYGKENFIKEIIEIIDDDEKHEYTSKREIYWIKELNTLSPNGYNISKGGEGGADSESAKKSAATRKASGYIVSKETRQKISIGNKGKPKSELHKQHLSDHHHNKTTHVLYFIDGHTELSDLSIEKLVAKPNTSEIKLQRASEVGDWRCGNFFLLDRTNFEKAFNYKNRYSKEPICYDPIQKIDVSPMRLRSLKQHQKEEYKNISIFNYNLDLLLEQQQYIKKMQEILEKALKEKEN